MALAWAIYLCGAQCFAWHITCKTHLDAQFCSSLNFIQCQEYARHPAFLLGQRGEVWAAMPPLDSGRWVFSSQNTPVFLCWQEWFPAQWIAQAQKRTTENHIGSLSEIWSIAVSRLGAGNTQPAALYCRLAQLNKFWLEFIGIGSLLSVSCPVSPQWELLDWAGQRTAGRCSGLKNLLFFVWKKRKPHVASRN